MNGTNNLPGPIRRARLMSLPAVNVYEELQELASRRVHRLARPEETLDEETEQALLQRSDPLILLALAQFGSSAKVGTVLYRRSQSNQGDPAYWSAIRQAILGNRWLPPMGNPFIDAIVLDENEIRRIFSDSDLQDANIVLKTPSAKTLLARLYNRKTPFHDITEEKLIRCVYASCGNPCINDDDSNREGPDLDARDLQKGIWSLLKALPVSEHTMQVLLYLLLQVDPRLAHCPDEDPSPVLQRWQVLTTTEAKDSETNGFPWSYTGSGKTLDFCVLLAALYGRYVRRSESHSFEYINVGSATSPDLLLRCAFYGRSLLSSCSTNSNTDPLKAREERKSLLVKAMQNAYQRDKDVFVFAAMCDSSLFENHESRALLETYMRGRSALHRYWERCNQIRGRLEDFDVTPVTDQGRRLLESVGLLAPPTDDQKLMQALQVSTATIQKAVSELLRPFQWVVTLLVIIVVMIWWRT